MAAGPSSDHLSVVLAVFGTFNVCSTNWCLISFLYLAYINHVARVQNQRNKEVLVTGIWNKG